MTTAPTAPRASYDATAWREEAACQVCDPELFFPVGTAGLAVSEIAQAKTVCAGCPVRQACLTFALDTHQQYGIWGGCDERERRELHWRRRQALR